ncbi:hypothetical protein HXX76_015260 [Chlamydomonas incerta]|uniref:Uncharacterized protein n=1 Tax=Chlamydomonas incerta TaxID=51695 RepID=A0A835SEY2_CHLIN|nr:hypothetical protein HXX76_015260 [Chlamydomonas incerta]|eukprot:KAG2423512.1 hypothetical protein HXX76_015260 [Chlamydomonas incerta]
MSAHALAESAAAQQASASGAGLTESASAAAAPPPPLPLPAPLVLPAEQLKPGRVFVVANLAGAYYTLLELLARHQFDFRTDNLLHVGNLVAAASAGDGAAAGCRNSASVLKLMRRHFARGPLGTNECLALLAAARANRTRAEEERRAVAAQQAAAAAAGLRTTSALSLSLRAPPSPLPAAPAAPAAVGAGATAAAEPAPMSPVASEAGGGCGAAAFGGAGAASLAVPCGPRRPLAATSGCSVSDSESDTDSDSDSDSDDDCGAATGAAGYRRGGGAEPATSACSHPAPPAASTCASTACSGSASAAAAAAAGGLDNLALAQLLSLPHCVVLAGYGVALAHAGPPPPHEAAFLQRLRHPHLGEPPAAAPADTAAGPEPEPRFHLVFSHRRPGAAAAAAAAAVSAAGGAAAATGLTLSGRGDVVRCAVLPPLRVLLRRSPGFAAKLGSGRAPSRQELMMEVVEEPLSDLDRPAAQQQQQ